MTSLMKRIFLVCCISLSSLFVSAQMVNDYGAVATGTWATVSIWRQWDGLGWNTIPVSFPNSSTTNMILPKNPIRMLRIALNESRSEKNRVLIIAVKRGVRLFNIPASPELIRCSA